MVGQPKMAMAIDDPSNQEQQAAHQKRNLYALLKYLDMTISSLVDLA